MSLLKVSSEVWDEGFPCYHFPRQLMHIQWEVFWGNGRLCLMI